MRKNHYVFSKSFEKNIYSTASFRVRILLPQSHTVMRLAIYQDIMSWGRSSLWPFRFVAVSVCGLSYLWPFRPVAVPVCGPSGLWPFRSVALPVCGRCGLCRFGCGRFGLWPLWPVTVTKSVYVVIYDYPYLRSTFKSINNYVYLAFKSKSLIAKRSYIIIVFPPIYRREKKIKSALHN